MRASARALEWELTVMEERHVQHCQRVLHADHAAAHPLLLASLCRSAAQRQGRTKTVRRGCEGSAGLRAQLKGSLARRYKLVQNQRELQSTAETAQRPNKQTNTRSAAEPNAAKADGSDRSGGHAENKQRASKCEPYRLHRSTAKHQCAAQCAASDGYTALRRCDCVQTAANGRNSEAFGWIPLLSG
jgi:hypothetical protein